MSMSQWLTRIGGGNLIKKIICSSLTLSHYQATASSSFPSLLSNSYSCSSTNAAFFGARHYKSMKTEGHLLSEDDDDEEEEEEDGSTLEERQGINFPGGEIAYTTEMNFLPGSSKKRVQCYRVLDEDGYTILSSVSELVSKELALKVYSGMITLNTMDKFLYEAQRQGRLSFYLTTFGEEAINLGSAAALSSEDIVLAQYREAGILLWRGFTVQDFAKQCFGNNDGHGKGRQMPIHYGSKNLNFVTISSPLTTQLPQAVGTAYSLKMDKRIRV